MPVLARLKPLAEMPSHQVCCEQQRQSFARTAGVVVLEVDPSRVVIGGPSACRHCGVLHGPEKCYRVIRTVAGPAVPGVQLAAIDCFEFDEGT